VSSNANADPKVLTVTARAWNILTGEYPPQHGGVADHTWQLAHGLAARGEKVEVWAPRCLEAVGGNRGTVTVHRLIDHFGWRGLLQLNASIARVPDAVLLVQYVPHAFGWKAMNLPLCLWLATRRRTEVVVIFHEVSYPFRANQAIRHSALGGVTRLMASTVARAAKRIYVAIPGWEAMLPESVRRRTPIRWMPVPSNVPRIDDPASSRSLNRRYRGRYRYLLGHFGSYGSLIKALLLPLMITLLSQRSDTAFLLLGEGGEEFVADLIAREPFAAGRVHATGRLRAEDLSRYLAACDLMVQPYPDGISSRRGTAMAALSHGIPMVSNVGTLSESIWNEARAVALGQKANADAIAIVVAQMLDDEVERRRVANAGFDLYTHRFDLRHTIDVLRWDVARDFAA
jgi:glycosyltransferase involved in cell wall biosynthesis